MSVLLETSLGDIVIDTFYDTIPDACLNFLKLCKIKYYNDAQFFRVENGFIAQTGDPTNTGDGGASIFAACQPSTRSLLPHQTCMKLTHAVKGTVSFTSSVSPNDGTKKVYASQFFITLSDRLEYLDADHTIFGRVAEGLTVVDKLAAVAVDHNHCPFRVLRIRHTIILDDPFEDPPGMPSDCVSPPPDQTVPNDRLPSDDDDESQRTHADRHALSHERLAHLQDQQDEREARSRAEVLEMIGDIADSDMKPPDNVLFVCKLNAVTEAEDLQIIFSRFGECKADIIQDRETGDSLCYAFIEFETKTQCEKAYFKMDNALIDDRRVHVDFSQSVSKLWNQARVAKIGSTPSFNRP